MTTDDVELPRHTPVPHADLVRHLELEQPGATADVYVWRADRAGAAVVQAMWDVRDPAGGGVHAESEMASLEIAQLGDDALYSQTTPWTLDGIWPEGVLVHREADEAACELFWAPRNGPVTRLDAACGHGVILDAAVVADRLVTLTVADSGDAELRCQGLDGALLEHVRFAIEGDVTPAIARVRERCAVALIPSGDRRHVSLHPVTGPPLPPIDLSTTEPPRICADAGSRATTEVFAVAVAGAVVDLAPDRDGACVRRFSSPRFTAVPTVHGIRAIESSDVPRHQHRMRCATTRDRSPDPAGE